MTAAAKSKPHLGEIIKANSTSGGGTNTQTFQHVPSLFNNAILCPFLRTNRANPVQIPLRCIWMMMMGTTRRIFFFCVDLVDDSAEESPPKRS